MPVRICDLGGWTDTWFAGHGAVLNIAVEPGVEVSAAVTGRFSGEPIVTIDAADFGDRYRYPVSRPVGKHPLIEAAVAEAGVREQFDLELSVRSAVPPGAGAGTSASVVVAVIAALDWLGRGEVRPPMELARAAHAVETIRLARQSGVQDQLAAAHGGVSFIEIERYPEARISPVALSSEVRSGLEQRLLLVYLGRGHDSTAVHRQVISELEASPADALARLDPLRAAAHAGRAALEVGDLAGLGRAMRDSSVAQSRLHRELVSPMAHVVFEVAERHRALGWKVNGAGGHGGSVTVLCEHGDDRVVVADALVATDEDLQVLPVALAERGATVTC